MKKILLFSSIFLIVFSFAANAQQSSCAFKLQEAENLYESGILDSIPSLLRNCINNNGFDEEELSRAYKLLVLTYLFEDYQEMAELTMLKFLKEFPEYEIKPTDPIEFKYLHDSYQTIPTFSVGLLLGGNYSYARIIEPYYQSGLEDYNGEYSAVFKFQGGLQFTKYINDQIDINLDVIYTLRSFDYSAKQLEYDITYSENQSLISFPVSATYDFKVKMLEPFVRIGVNTDYLLSATADFTRDIDIKENGYDITGDRNTINISALVGGGVKYNIKMGYIMIDLRYHYSFMNLVNDEYRFTDSQGNNIKYANFNYVDDDFTLNNFYFSFGYVYSFYKTKRNK